tara:strand:- start:160 stop:675 length:516 start_codon:yes stop_codon:yes gene_type:complete
MEKPNGKVVAINPKPVTYVTTYRGVRGFPKGMHEGVSRDVVIAGTEIPSRGSIGGYNFVPAALAEQGYNEAERVMEDFTGRIDQMFVYLGANGAGPGFEYIRGIMDEGNGGHVCIVACDCGAYEKERFADNRGLGLIWSECGGQDTLARIVRDTLRTGTPDQIPEEILAYR